MVGHVQVGLAKSQSSGGHIAAIDGLRAVAALAVLAYHLHHGLMPGGFAGVDLFFVISGFVIARSTSRIVVPDSGAMVLAFYRKRFVRILPALLTCLLATQVAMVLWVPVNEPVGVADLSTVAASLGLSNIVLWQEAGDYFSPALDYLPTTHTWSLGVEEQFYLIVPFIAFALWRLPVGSIGRRVAQGLVVLLTLVSLILAMIWTKLNPTLTFYLLPFRLWELGAGMLLAMVLAGRNEHPSSAWLNPLALSVLAWVALALLAATLIGWTGGAFPFPGAIPVVLAGLLLVALAEQAPNTPVMRLLASPVMRYFGGISYALYLWHMPVIVVLRWTVGCDRPALWLGAAMLSWLLAHVTTQYIERPIRNSGWLKRRGDGVLTLLGLGAMVCGGLAIYALTLARPVLSLTTSRDASVWSGEAPAAAGPCGVRYDSSHLPGHGMMASFAPQSCALIQPIHLFVVGDSHALSYQHLLGTMAAQKGLGSTLLMTPSCPYLQINQTGIDCEPFLDAALRQAGMGQAGDVLFLPGLRSARYRDFWQDDFAAPAPPKVWSQPDLAREAARLKPLLDKGMRVIIEAPKPVWPSAPMRCADWFNRANPHCRTAALTLKEAQAHRAPALALIARLQAIEPRLELWDPFPLLCHSDPCPAWQQGKPLVRDGDHLSAWGNELLTPSFEAMLAPTHSSGLSGHR